MSEVVKALREAGMVELRNTLPKSLGKDKSFAAYAMYLPKHDKVWINSTRRLPDLIDRFLRWKRNHNTTKIWAHQVHELLGRDRNIRFFYDPKQFINLEAFQACQALDAVIPRKSLPRNQSTRIFLVEQPSTGYYRLLSDQGNRATQSILTAWLNQARLQIGATHRVVDQKIRIWANANQTALRDPSQFTIQELASFDHSFEAVDYMRDFADERGRELCLNVIFRVR